MTVTEQFFDELSWFEQLALAPDDVQVSTLAELTLDELADPELWLRPDQLAAMHSLAAVILMLAGRGAGKTRTGASWTNEKAEQQAGCMIHLVGRTVGDVRDVMVRGEAGIIAVARPTFVPEYVPSLRLVRWPNGSQALTFSSEKPGQLRGPQCHYLWGDELAAWNHRPDDSGANAWDNAKIGTRLGDQPQSFITTTPKRVKVVKDLKAQVLKRGDEVHSGSTFSNRAHLATDYLENLVDMYAGTALERQELYGELLDVIEGAMFRAEDIVGGTMEFLTEREYDAGEITDLLKSADLAPEKLMEVLGAVENVKQEAVDIWSVVGVDPGLTTGGDATGIITVRGTRELTLTTRRLLVTGDYTEENLAPEAWAARVVEAWRAERDATGKVPIVVAESNAGGELVTSVIKAEAGDHAIPVALIPAKGTKAARAEPVVLAHRKNRVRYDQAVLEADGFDLMVDELTGWEPPVPGGAKGSGWSPNRLDAFAHACRAIIVDESPLRRFGNLTPQPAGTVVNVPKGRWKEGRQGSLKPSWRD